jgi:hypothetical protein
VPDVTMRGVGPDLSQATPMGAEVRRAPVRTSGQAQPRSTNVAGSAASKPTAAPVASEPVPLSWP